MDVIDETFLTKFRACLEYQRAKVGTRWVFGDTHLKIIVKNKYDEEENRAEELDEDEQNDFLQDSSDSDSS
ncbi:hypothetical protein JTB14_009917 [Gonioctena quinquepunctata]|nr:hypothetical protein JTB14_009917 [Gonioctena quinquepunctata]